MTPLLSMNGISRRFGRTVALDEVALEVHRGQVHALVGENGAGKSTLMKILSGAERADAGRIMLDEQPYAPHTPPDAIRLGVVMIYQEFNLAPQLSVRANLLLGRERTAGGVLWGELSGGDDARCRSALDQLGLHLDLHARVRDLGIADQQMIEIARALTLQARLLIMDEPTSALAAGEVRRLFKVIRQLRARGISIIYISHFLEELDEIADCVTVLRDGRAVGSGTMSDWPRPRLIEAMVGRRVEEMYPQVPHAPGEPLLRVAELRGAKLPRSAGFTLHRGEIFGIAGLVGAGRTEMLRTLFGLDPRRGGVAELGGVRIEHFSPADWVRRRVGMLSEDRKEEGLAQSLSCAANLSLSSIAQLARFGWLSRKREARAASALRRRLDIRWASPDQMVSALSGGNQQKVAMARLLFSDADVLLLDEPTRGIDVGAKVDLYRTIGQLAVRGKGIIIVSSYLPELLGICDRLAVMRRGELSAAYPVRELTADDVMNLAT